MPDRSQTPNVEMNTQTPMTSAPAPFLGAVTGRDQRAPDGAAAPQGLEAFAPETNLMWKLENDHLSDDWTYHDTLEDAQARVRECCVEIASAQIDPKTGLGEAGLRFAGMTHEEIVNDLYAEHVESIEEVQVKATAPAGAPLPDMLARNEAVVRKPALVEPPPLGHPLPLHPEYPVGVPELVLIRGLAGSGKSTLARAMEGFQHLETDQFFEQNGGFDGQLLAEAREWCEAQAREALAGGGKVVVANTFARPTEMAPYFKAALDLGASVRVATARGEWPSSQQIPAATLAMEKAAWVEDATFEGYKFQQLVRSTTLEAMLETIQAEAIRNYARTIGDCISEGLGKMAGCATTSGRLVFVDDALKNNLRLSGIRVTFPPTRMLVSETSRYAGSEWDIGMTIAADGRDAWMWALNKRDSIQLEEETYLPGFTPDDAADEIVSWVTTLPQERIRVLESRGIL